MREKDSLALFNGNASELHRLLGAGIESITLSAGTKPIMKVEAHANITGIGLKYEKGETRYQSITFTLRKKG